MCSAIFRRMIDIFSMRTLSPGAYGGGGPACAGPIAVTVTASPSMSRRVTRPEIPVPVKRLMSMP